MKIAGTSTGCEANSIAADNTYALDRPSINMIGKNQICSIWSKFGGGLGIYIGFLPGINSSRIVKYGTISSHY